VLGAQLALADGDLLARVGEVAVDHSLFLARAALVPPWGWAELGASWSERRRRLLDVLVDEVLFGVAAEQRSELPSARDVALARALRAELRHESGLAASRAELQAFAAGASAAPNEARALELYRILVRTEGEARALIAELATPNLTRFGQLARRASIDGATSMRSGYLGWVAADGQTDVPELRVAPELFRAAETAADGTLLGQPVREGDAFALVWRRASRPARAAATAPLEQRRTAQLAEERRAETERALLEALRREHLTDHHPERLAGFEPAFSESGHRTPTRAAPDLVAPWLTPVPTDRGLR